MLKSYDNKESVECMDYYEDFADSSVLHITVLFVCDQDKMLMEL